MLILTLAFVKARLTSFVIDTLTQKIPESLKKCRRMSWQSEEGLTALQMVITGTWQSASDTTVHTSVGRLERGGKGVNSPSGCILWFQLNFFASSHLPWQETVKSTAFCSISVSRKPSATATWTICTLSMPSENTNLHYSSI